MPFKFFQRVAAGATLTPLIECRAIAAATTPDAFDVLDESGDKGQP